MAITSLGVGATREDSISVMKGNGSWPSEANSIYSSGIQVTPADRFDPDAPAPFTPGDAKTSVASLLEIGIKNGLSKAYGPSEWMEQVVSLPPKSPAVMLRRLITSGPNDDKFKKLLPLLSKADGESIPLTQFSFDHSQRGSAFSSLKAAFKSQYESYLESIGSLYGEERRYLSTGSTSPEDDLLFGVFMIMPLIFLTIYGGYGLISQTSSPTGQAPPMKLTRQSMTKMFSDCRTNYETFLLTDKKKFTLPKQRQLLKHVVYFMTGQNVKVTT